MLLAADLPLLAEELGQRGGVLLGGEIGQVGSGHLLGLQCPFDAGRRDRLTEVALLGEEDRLAVQLGRGRGATGRAGVEGGEHDRRGEHRQRKADRLLHGISFSERSVGSDGHDLNTGPERWRRPEGRFFKILTPARPRGRRKRLSYPKGWGKGHLLRRPDPSTRLFGLRGRFYTFSPGSSNTDCRKGGRRKPEEVHHEVITTSHPALRPRGAARAARLGGGGPGITPARFTSFPKRSGLRRLRRVRHLPHGRRGASHGNAAWE